MKVNFGLIQEMVVLGFGSDKNQHLNENLTMALTIF